MDQWMSLLAPQLRALEELAKQDGHMTRAADSLGIPQSSMSRRIHALEKTLGVRLLTQEGRTVRLTPAAVQLAEQTRRPLRELEAIVETIAGEADPEHGTIRFGFPLTMGAGVVPTLVAEFHRRAPGIRLQIKQAHGSELATDLKAGTLDVAVVIPPPEDVQHVVIGVQQIRAVLPAAHPLAARRRLRLDELSGETFIANPVSYHLRRATETWCRDAGFTPHVPVEITEFATIRELVSRGMGIALLPHDEHTSRKVREIPLTPNTYQRQIALAWASTAVTPAARRLLTFLRTEWSGKPGAKG
ncbi:LysR family transcriptional regulator [Mycobacterium sp. CBMA293]|uniref:LysR family transcriptional regulator n=1 Tax=unclassified Mycolicibacterium TaxID=2636767 RepID=UPI0012DC4835|nr:MULTISPECIES: LysR family transcriptional regulator [unclassified Mycolicibacterium]MUL49982.1 LysR family transcriptional regulator [Mycolicibacterium sp. CBMA 360]MUL61571.1 LysR family transcriptional regulator [Mycolicibacterium sp. CBMA 335]MUL74306.1 LysR family transcriptional regulator [Mycolicibacterium sp. CBMA 311]MUL96584.1 LysR family transcriptional regulator [Mycolicibacterium sp. CBMA 230]MUM04258.1 LysR family transcriptional regulator [Mycolicibacterium sp. CBMA 213]